MERARRTFDPHPLAILFSGLAVAILGVATTYAFPETRTAGLNAATVLQCLAIFGGMATMLVGAHMAHADTRAERGAHLREAVRGLLAFLLLLAVLTTLHMPFAVMVALAATPWTSERLRASCAWLGR